jgi:hypothetical protein
VEHEQLLVGIIVRGRREIVRRSHGSGVACSDAGGAGSPLQPHASNAGTSVVALIPFTTIAAVPLPGHVLDAVSPFRRATRAAPKPLADSPNRS